MAKAKTLPAVNLSPEAQGVIQAAAESLKANAAAIAIVLVGKAAEGDKLCLDLVDALLKNAPRAKKTGAKTK